MSHLFVLLVLLLTTFLSSLFSPASGDDEVLPLDSFFGLSGSNIGPEFGPVPRGGVGEVRISKCAISFCFGDLSECNGTLVRSGPPAGTQLISTNEAVAEVSGVFIGLENPGSTTLQLRRIRDDASPGELLASYILLVMPDAPNTTCDPVLFARNRFPECGEGLFSSDPSVVDCSGKCVSRQEADLSCVDP